MILVLASLARVRSTSRHRLLALAIALAACGGEASGDDGTSGDDSGANATGSSSGVTTTMTSGLDTGTGAASTTGPSDDSTGVTSGTSGDDATSAASTGDTGATTSTGTEGDGTSGSDGSTTGEPPNPACVAGCTTQVDCNMDYPSVDACVQWCDDNLDMALLFSPACHDAWENLSACFGNLSCDEYAEYLSPSMFPYPCSDQADALAFQCEGQ